MDDHGGETTGLTLGGILSIKQTPPYGINRTLLDLIRDDHHQPYGNEQKLTWKMLRKKFRLRLVGTGCNTAVPTLASHVTVTVNADNGNGVVNSNSTSLRSHLNLPVSSEITAAREVEEAARGVEEVARGEQSAARMSLMSLLEVDGSGYADVEGGDDVDDDVAEVVTVVGESERYNNCCVCMVRHKGAAFIPCGHTFCRLCSRELFVKRASCPLCNHFIVEILDIF